MTPQEWLFWCQIGSSVFVGWGIRQMVYDVTNGWHEERARRERIAHEGKS